MIGHMILRRGGGTAASRDVGGSSAAILGLKIIGGKLLEGGRTGAVIDKVKRGSIADVEGQLRPGNQKTNSSHFTNNITSFNFHQCFVLSRIVV